LDALREAATPGWLAVPLRAVERLSRAAECTGSTRQPKTDGVDSYQIAYTKRPLIRGRELHHFACDFVALRE
jgi:hypothetical protein